jgi:hypothetical protein
MLSHLGRFIIDFKYAANFMLRIDVQFLEQFNRTLSIAAGPEGEATS